MSGLQSAAFDPREPRPALVSVTAMMLIVLSVLAGVAAVRQEVQILYGRWYFGYLAILIGGQVASAIGIWRQRRWAAILALVVMAADQLFELYLGEGGWISSLLRAIFAGCLLLEFRWFR